MFLQNVCRHTTYNDNNHSNRFSMLQRQVPSYKTSAPPAQSTAASIWSTLTTLSSTWSTERTCRRSSQHVDNVGRVTLRPRRRVICAAHRRSNCSLWAPESNCQLPIETTSRCTGTRTLTCLPRTSTCALVSTSTSAMYLRRICAHP